MQRPFASSVWKHYFLKYSKAVSSVAANCHRAQMADQLNSQVVYIIKKSLNYVEGFNKK